MLGGTEVLSRWLSKNGHVSVTDHSDVENIGVHYFIVCYGFYTSISFFIFPFISFNLREWCSSGLHASLCLYFLTVNCIMFYTVFIFVDI